jgi:hypothetical protein
MNLYSQTLLVLSSQRAILLVVDRDRELQGRLHRNVDLRQDRVEHATGWVRVPRPEPLRDITQISRQFSDRVDRLDAVSCYIHPTDT